MGKSPSVLLILLISLTHPQLPIPWGGRTTKAPLSGLFVLVIHFLSSAPRRGGVGCPQPARSWPGSCWTTLLSRHLGLSLSMFPPRALEIWPIFSSPQLLRLEKDPDLTASRARSLLFLKRKLWAMASSLIREKAGTEPVNGEPTTGLLAGHWLPTTPCEIGILTGLG